MAIVMMMIVSYFSISTLVFSANTLMMMIGLVMVMVMVIVMMMNYHQRSPRFYRPPRKAAGITEAPTV